MKNILPKLFLLAASTFMSLVSIAADGEKGKEKIWTRWELCTTAEIYYRVEVPQGEAAKTISVEFLNNYKKEVSFVFAIGDSGSPETRFKPVYGLKKKKTTIVEYPVPTTKITDDAVGESASSAPFVVTLASIQFGK